MEGYKIAMTRYKIAQDLKRITFLTCWLKILKLLFTRIHKTLTSNVASNFFSLLEVSKTLQKPQKKEAGVCGG